MRPTKIRSRSGSKPKQIRPINMRSNQKQGSYRQPKFPTPTKSAKQFPDQHIIIASNLHREHEEKLLQVLRQHKKAIGWKLSDLPRINPSICMHRILMEGEACLVRQQQRRLNPTILDVVKKEVTKLLAARNIYPILDSNWVNLVQDCMEVFMDDFTVYADTFVACLGHLARVLKRCIETDLVLNFEKCHFMAFHQELQQDRLVVVQTITRLTSTPIIQTPNWELPFELMCDASNLALGAVLGQRDEVGQPTHVIAYAFRTMDQAQINYTTTEKELLEFDLEIKDKKGVNNAVADHLSRIECEPDPMPIRDDFPNEQLLHMDTSTPWFADICNFIVASQFPPEASQLYKEKIKSDAKYYIWDDPYLWKHDSDQVIRKCILDSEISSVFHFCHAEAGGVHHGSTRTARKVLDCGFYWPTIFLDAHQFLSTCEQCQRVGMAMSYQHDMPQQPILFCEVFNVWGINFIGPFPVSNGYSYILLVMEYMSRWVEAVATKTNDAKIWCAESSDQQPGKSLLPIIRFLAK
ncbi:putative mitochondrial protein, partial [Mucuna pruriens]